MSTPKSEDLIYNVETCGYKECAPCNMSNYEMLPRFQLYDYLDQRYAEGDITYTFVDIGAHVGLWSLAASAYYQARFNFTPAIYAFEPMRANFEVLQRNATQQPPSGITPVRAIVWNTTGSLKMIIDKHPARSCVAEEHTHTPMETERVQCLTLDSVSRGSRKIDAMKIDVEGSELRVLNGARELIEANERMLVFVEFCQAHLERYGNNVTQLDAFLRAVGFRPNSERDADIVTLLKGESHRSDVVLLAYRKGK